MILQFDSFCRPNNSFRQLTYSHRSDTFATEFDLEAEEYVPLPKGDVHKRKEVQTIFLIET